MEEGFLYNIDSRGETAVEFFEQVGWMSGDKLKREHPDAWIFKGRIVNQRLKIIAWRCPSCAVVELTIGQSHPATSEGLSAEVKALADDPAQKIQAIKLHREQSGLGLKQATDAVEAYIEGRK
jgi:hypothetical protein